MGGWALAASACAGPGTPAPPPGLTYRLPDPPAAAYRMSDTVQVGIQAMGQAFSVEGGARSDWRMEFAPDTGGVRVTATLLDLDARMSNPLGADQTVDEADVDGQVVFVLDPRGNPTLVSVPELGSGAAQFFTGSTIAHGFFPRLPGRVLALGESWVDTVSYTSDDGGAESTVRTIWTYTAAGDSSVAGAIYQLVRASGQTEQSSGGTIAGTDFTQSVSGGVTGHFLWDGAAGLLHSSEYRSELSGESVLSIAPVPLQVTVRSTVRVERTP
jgi:hypothetical protein